MALKQHNVHYVSVAHSSRFRKTAGTILHIYLGIALDSIWKQSRLDDSQYVVVSFFIANL
jgi:hypothetical protein